MEVSYLSSGYREIKLNTFARLTTILRDVLYSWT